MLKKDYFIFKQIFLIIILFNSFVYSEDKVHTVLILKDWKPYYSLDKNGKPTGYAIELFEILAKDAGIKYKYKLHDNWSQMSKLRKSGEEYIIPNTGIAKMRASYTLFSELTDTFQINYFKRKDSFNIKTKNDLANKKVAVVEVNVCMKLVKDKNIEKVVYKDRFIALSELLSGEVDAMCYPKPLLEIALNKLNLSNKIVSFGEPLKEIKRGMGFSLNNAHLIPKFNESIKKLKKNREYEKIYQKWFITNDDAIKLTYEQIVLLSSFVIIVLIVISFSFYYISRKNRWLLSNNELQTIIDEQTKELELTLDLYNKALSVTQDGIWDWDVSTDIVYYSPTWKIMLGYDLDEVENKFSEWERLVHPDDLGIALEKNKKLASGEVEIYFAEFRMLCKDGSYKWILSRGKVVEKDSQGKPKRIVGAQSDLTMQKEKERQLLDQKEEFESIFRNSKDGIAIVDLESKFLDFNDAYLNMLGYTRDELRQKTCVELSINEDKNKSIDVLAQIINKGSIENFEKKCLTKDNTQITVNMTATLLPDKKRILVITRNVSSLKLVQEQSKLASMGEMIGNIAHQWRQPLSIITMSANNIRVDSELGMETKDSINDLTDLINKNAKYLSNTIDDFKNFIKGDKNYSLISIKKSIEESLSLTDVTRKQHYINLVTDIEEDMDIYGNKNELEQAFINILNNAKDILSEDENIKDKYIFIKTKKLKDSLELEICDNGGGIKENIINRIFEPYFTTKHQSIGTGLGLTMVDTIVRERHGAFVKVENKDFDYNGTPYRGACFILRFTAKEK